MLFRINDLPQQEFLIISLNQLRPFTEICSSQKSIDSHETSHKSFKHQSSFDALFLFS